MRNTIRIFDTKLLPFSFFLKFQQPPLLARVFPNTAHDSAQLRYLSSLGMAGSLQEAEHLVHTELRVRRLARLGVGGEDKIAVITHEGWADDAGPIASISRRLSWTALERLSNIIAVEVSRLLRGESAATLRGKPRLALLAANSGEWLAAAIAASVAGVVLVPLNTRWSPREMADTLADSGAVMVLHDGGARATMLDRVFDVLSKDYCGVGIAKTSGGGGVVRHNLQWALHITPHNDNNES